MDKEEITVSNEETKAETKTGQSEMKATVIAIQEKMEAAISSIRSNYKRPSRANERRQDVLA
jgi:hypothetical protein